MGTDSLYSLTQIIDLAREASKKAHKLISDCDRLENLNMQVFRTIMCPEGFSSISRGNRDVVIPVLFARCMVDIQGSLGIPSETIRPFIR